MTPADKRLLLAGCTPEPLMSYLKALGILRLVPGASCAWEPEGFVLRSSFGQEGLMRFFLQQYAPTPILAPWNGGSGFYGSGSEPLEIVAASTAATLHDYRSAITAIRRFVPPGESKPKDEEKEAVLIRCRAELPDRIVPWLDTCFVLGEKGPRYFPLLGTGGNDGRLDFTNNFMQRLREILPFDEGEEPPAASAGWLEASLFRTGMTQLGKSAIGQFHPGGIGGANATQGCEGNSRVNPWDYVLMIEGALLLAGSVARRLGTDARDRAAFPFSVNASAVGYGSAAGVEETTDGSRAELWLPLWSQPANCAEIAQLFAEGRAQFGRRQAHTGVEFALAVAGLGVSRGIEAFVRYGFLKRNGLAFLAAPLGRFAVTPHPEINLLDDGELQTWLDRLRSACRDKSKTPARYLAALRQIDRAIFACATRAQTDQVGESRALLEVLRALGRAERVLANGRVFRKENRIPPLQGLNPQWLEYCDDGSTEFRLAAALASIQSTKEVGALRAHLEPVAWKGRYVWDDGSTSAVCGQGDLTTNLAAIFRRRLMECERSEQKGLALQAKQSAFLPDIAAFLDHATDDERLTELLWGLQTLNWSEPVPMRFTTSETTHLPWEFSLLRLVVHPVKLRVAIRNEEASWQTAHAEEGAAIEIRADAAPFHALYARDPEAVMQAVDSAMRRLKASGFITIGQRCRSRRPSPERSSRLIPHRLLAAMLFPLPNTALAELANDVLFPPVVVS